MFKPDGQFRHYWDLFLILFLLYVALVVPFVEAFSLTATVGSPRFLVEVRLPCQHAHTVSSSWNR